MAQQWKIRFNYFPFPNRDRKQEAYEMFVESIFHQKLMPSSLRDADHQKKSLRHRVDCRNSD